MDILNIRALLRTKSIYDIPLRVTYYARVSSESDEQLNSLDNQIAYYEDLIRRNRAWTYIQGYVDEGLSGISTKKRKHFNEMIADAKTAATYNDTEVRSLITANKTAIDTLIGSVDGDNAKSAREMAHEEVAKIVDGAPESFDTLKEISSWISTHSDSAVTMDNSIKANAAAIEKLNGDASTTGSVAKAVSDGVTPVANRVTAIENKVTDEKVAKWDAAQANKIESIKVGDTALTIGEDKSVALPAATAAALGLVKVDGTSIESKNGVIGVKAVNVSTLYVADGDELVLNGGNA